MHIGSDDGINALIRQNGVCDLLFSADIRNCSAVSCNVVAELCVKCE